MMYADSTGPNLWKISFRYSSVQVCGTGCTLMVHGDIPLPPFPPTDTRVSRSLAHGAQIARERATAQSHAHWSTCDQSRNIPSDRCCQGVPNKCTHQHTRGGRGWHKASVSDCLPLAAPIGLSPLLILTLCGPERVLVVSTEPLDDLSCLTTPGVGRHGDGLLPVPLTRCIQTHTPSPCGGLPTDLCALRCASAMAKFSPS